MAFNYIEETRNIVETLRKENLGTFADSVQEAMDYSFIGSELVESVYGCLLKIPPDSMSPITRKRVEIMLKELKKIIDR